MSPLGTVPAYAQGACNAPVLNPTSLSLAENGSASFTIKLNAAPLNEVYVTLSSTDTDKISLQTNREFTFTTSNWNNVKRQSDAENAADGAPAGIAEPGSRGRVRDGDGDGGGDTGKGAIAPAPPQFSRASARNGSVLLSWRDADDNGGPPISHYAYRYGTGLNLYDPWTDIPESGPGEANANGYTVPDTLKAGTLYTFRLRAVNEEGMHSDYAQATVVVRAVTTNTEEEELPTEVALLGNYPNPFNPQTRIDYALPSAVHVRLAVYDMQGREVRILENGVRPAGRHTAAFDAADLPGGVYVYRLETPEKIVSKAATLIK